MATRIGNDQQWTRPRSGCHRARSVAVRGSRPGKCRHLLTAGEQLDDRETAQRTANNPTSGAPCTSTIGESSSGPWDSTWMPLISISLRDEVADSGGELEGHVPLDAVSGLGEMEHSSIGLAPAQLGLVVIA